ncbi:MAG TPA: hypothetical protein HA263_10425, partial [Methanoregulaceae archaeon]|nr:hypothetical protein [Methanoregulaceae archaeon]
MPPVEGSTFFSLPAAQPAPPPGTITGRTRRALAAVEAGSVRRYPGFVVGTRDEYIVEDGLCTCDRSLIRNGFRRHQLAARIA